MRAAILNNYNKNGTKLEIKEIPMPSVGDNDVLIKVKTAGVNPLDNMIIRSEVKLIVPYKLPLVMGNEFCGIVEKTGKNVADFSAGDRVYGRMPLKNIGAFSEYIAVDMSAISKVPEYLSDEEAATVPLTALTSLQAFELMDIKPGKSIFISGGTGSLGAMAIPIAKSFGLTVTTSGSAENKNRVLELGADRFFDYKKEDYSKVLSNVDYVLDTLGERELVNEFRILKEGGSIVSLRGLPNGEFAKRMNMPLIKQLLFSIAGKKYDKLAAQKGQTYYFIFVHEDGRGLKKVSKILEDNKIKPSVDSVFELNEINKALEKVANGSSKGKTVLRVV